MKLTTKSEYSLLAIIYIARHEKQGFVKIDKICKEYNIPKKYLENLLTIMKQNRYIKTMRGSEGGYMLAKNPEQISIAEIIRLMDGALAPTLSVSEYFFGPTPLQMEKKVMNVFKEIRDYIANKLEKLTINDLL